jgi:hypothetical protein
LEAPWHLSESLKRQASVQSGQNAQRLVVRHLVMHPTFGLCFRGFRGR